MIARLKAWLARRRAHRKSAAALAEIIAAVDALEGVYVILLNDYPLDPGDGFGPGDRLEIRFVDVPEEEERRIVEAVGRLNGKGFRIHCEEDDGDA
jgi:protein involved in polysaccharide export with SLBB domain